MLASQEHSQSPNDSAVAPTMARSAKHWDVHLGGLGFIPLGRFDRPLIPLPGSMDALIIVLSARNGGFWVHYALMVTVGSVVGGYVTYRLARKGGKGMLARKFPRRKLEKSYKIFRRWGFGAIAVPALLSPLCPWFRSSFGRRSHAIFCEQIPGRADVRPNYQVLHSGVPGSPLWTAHAHIHLAHSTPHPNGCYGANFHRGCSFRRDL
jgi:hypothetical protein